MESPPEPRMSTFLGMGGLSVGGTKSPLMASVTASAALFQGVPMRTRKALKRHSRSSGPAECSGWNCTEKTGRPSETMPSLVPSLALVKRGLNYSIVGCQHCQPPRLREVEWGKQDHIEIILCTKIAP